VTDFRVQVGIGGSCLEEDREPVLICCDPPYRLEEAAGCPAGMFGMPPMERGLGPML
jgi:hypothetical protein